MTKAEKARKLINEHWRDVMKEAVEKEFGKIQFETEYNFFTDKFTSTWRADKKLPVGRIREFVKGFEEGCLACQRLMLNL